MRRLEIAGHTWTLDVSSTPAFEARLATPKPGWVAVTGAGASVLLTLLVGLLASGRARAMRAAWRSASELRKSQEQLALVLEGSDDAYWDCNVQTGEIKRGARYAEMLGVRPDEVETGREGFEARLHPDDRAAVRAAVDAHLAGDATQYDVEYRMRTGEGGWRWLRSRGKVVERDAQGRPLRAAGTVSDVDAKRRADERQKAAEGAIRAAQRFAQSTLDAMSEQICVLDETGAVIAVNAAWRAFAAANEAPPEAVFEGSSYLDVCARARGPGSEEAAAFAEGLREVLAGARPSFSLEYPCHSSSEQRWFVASATRFAEDGPVRVVVAHMNITDRKEAELALSESEALLRGVVEAMPCPVYVKDEEGRMLLANPGTLRAVGKSVEAVLGKSDGEVHDHPSVSATLAQHDRLVMQSGRAHVFEERIDSPEGPRMFLATKSPRRDASGRIIGVIGMAQDITDRKRMELERERLLEEAWTATHRREQMLAVVAHDLRSPLAAVVLAAHALERFCSDPALRERQGERLEIIRTATERMGRLIEDLLDVAAIQSGRLRLSPAANDPLAIAREAVRGASPEAQRRELRLVLDAQGAPPTVRCDRGRILQVLANLLSNAFHATDGGGAVTVRVGERDGRVAFSVADTGRGLPPGGAERLFEPYQRGPNPGYKGAGLGLAIAKGIVDGHGGRIWAETPDGGGATFCFDLPRA